MLEKFLNIFRIPDLRKRVLFTLAILAVYRLGSHIPRPALTPTSSSFFSASRAGRPSASWIFSVAATCAV